MSWTRLLLLLCSLLSGLASAQAPDRGPRVDPPASGGAMPAPLLVSAPGEAEAGAPKDEIIPRDDWAAETGPTFSGSRLTLELLGELGGALAAGLVGALVGVAITPNDCNDFGCGWFYAVFTTPPAMAGGLAFGTYSIGRFMGGRGGFWPTLLGTVLGTAAGVGVGLLAPDKGAVMAIGVGVGALAGTAAGFEISHAYSGTPPPAQGHARTGLQVLPMAGVTRQGQVLAGLAGSF